MTLPAVTVKLAVVEPAAAVTDAGVVSAELLSDKATVEPPAGAAADNVTVQVAVAPDTTLTGEHASFETVTVAEGVTVTAAVPEPPFNVAVTVAD